MTRSSLPPVVRARRLRAPSKAPKPLGGALLTPKWWFEGVYLKVGAIPGSSVVVVERTRVPSGEADLSQVFGKGEDQLRRVKRDKFGLLIDVRSAPGRNDADFETKFEPYRRRIQDGFRRVAVLVATQHGKLQVQRYAREDRLASAVFDDYLAAVRWLDEP